MSDIDEEDQTDGVKAKDLLIGGALTGTALAAPPLLNSGKRSSSNSIDSVFESGMLAIGSAFARTFAALEARAHGVRVTSGVSPWASDHM